MAASPPRIVPSGIGPPRIAPPRIAIVGGGFSGAVVAVQLCRKLPGPAVIDIIEPRPLLGAGVAYSAADPAHRINVPAARMTVFAEDPAQFDRWLHATDALRQDPAARWPDGTAYPQRGWFGRYISERVIEATQGRPDIDFCHRRTKVVGIDPAAAGYRLVLADGDTLQADLVVLAVTHPPPALPAALRAVAAAGLGGGQVGAQVIADPWQPGALAGIAPDAAVLVVGTGLTMADVVASLQARNHRGTVLAVSRRGLLSRGHAPFDTPKHEWVAQTPPPTTALALSHTLRREVAQAACKGLPWQAVFDDVRSHAGRLWTALPVAEQRRLVRHLRPFWDVHRFRVAPQVEAGVERLRAAGQFQAWAASLLAAERRDGRIAVSLRRRGCAVQELACDVVIVTTGPAHGAVLANNPALAALAGAGRLRPDAAGLGIDVDLHSHPIGEDGTVSRDLLIAGPLARGRFGELMGLPQVSTHAELVAEAVIQALA